MCHPTIDATFHNKQNYFSSHVILHFSSVQLSRSLDNSGKIVTKYGIQDQCFFPTRVKGFAFLIVRPGAMLFFRPVSYPIIRIRTFLGEKEPPSCGEVINTCS
jgi:hypothetical protein